MDDDCQVLINDNEDDDPLIAEVGIEINKSS
jgi:hypothetical protein